MEERLPSQITKAKTELAQYLSGEPSLVGLGIGAGKSGRCEIVVFMAEETRPLLAKVPHSWQGIPVRTEVTGIPIKFGVRERPSRKP
ncbi:MAG: hypothetical protein ACREIQ_12470 [Nitrospiria bacterium]